MDGQGAGILCGVNPPADTNSLAGQGLIAVLIRSQAAQRALASIHFHLVAVVKSIENAWQIHHCRDVKFPRHDGAMGKVAARLHDQRARLEE